jgi:3-deoxy-manno-octulosonate cytidylyltransferase (CMP-KDO synthetase)
MNESVVALIPARYAATRFNGKLLAPLGGKSVIWRTYESSVQTGLFNEVIVVTDSDLIYEEITRQGGKAVKSRKEHESGTDRIAEAAGAMKVDIILNIQGDTPFVKKEPLKLLLNEFKDPSVQVGSLMQELKQQEYIDDSNYVKVAIDKNRNALFFSRSVIPYPRNKDRKIVYYEHIGVYAFRKQALLTFSSWSVSPLEDIEKIECLRYLENGVPIRMVVTDYMGVEIDTPEDLEKATRML